jgi:hypothetical protein
MTLEYPTPAVRKLRVYAFDPQAASERASINYAYATIALPWEEAWEEPLTIGPVNEYLEVIDVDPASRQFYEPVDLNNPHLLAQDGLTPSEGNPQFHQQMVFAVAMKVIRLFERALGRKVMWAPHWNPKANTYEPVRRLRIYPHALREANAYYSTEKRALLFGYFRSGNASAAAASWVFTALSHDIIAHETTHAVLDGLHRRYSEATSVDSLAFHEAFADIVALFSHFTLTEAVQAHIRDQGGQLEREGHLSNLAQQFAAGTSGRKSLRQYVGTAPDPDLLPRTSEPHDRGAILVAAVFDAFLTIYRVRTDDLLRISGVTRGDSQRLGSDLAARLTREAVKTADHVLRMCIRALDYLPPVDVRFGEFLRAIITADNDLVPNDTFNYRIAFAEAFRRRGILADNCLSMSPDNLLWESPERIFRMDPLDVSDIKKIKLDVVPHYIRDDVIRSSEENRRKLWHWLGAPDPKRPKIDRDWEEALGIYFVLPKRKKRRQPRARAGASKWRRGRRRNSDRLNSIFLGRWGGPAFEVHSVRTTRRSGPDGQDVRQLVVEITQRRRGYFDQKRQALVDDDLAPRGNGDFIFRGGATLIIDLRENRLRYVIRKDIDDDKRLQEQRSLLGEREGLSFTYLGDQHLREPFAMTHRGH